MSTIVTLPKQVLEKDIRAENKIIMLTSSNNKTNEYHILRTMIFISFLHTLIYTIFVTYFPLYIFAGISFASEYNF